MNGVGPAWYAYFAQIVELPRICPLYDLPDVDT